MVSDSGEAYLFFPFHLWSPRSVSETQIEGICLVTLVPSRTVLFADRRRELHRRQALLYVMGLLHGFLVTITIGTIEQLFQ